jgi:hypothetical protein
MNEHITYLTYYKGRPEAERVPLYGKSHPWRRARQRRACYAIALIMAAAALWMIVLNRFV